MSERPARGRKPPPIETLFVAAFALLGLRAGLRPIGDNSFFVHLRTGIDMLDHGAIPRRDPYSFTAAGEPWVVQSWLASAAYGSLHRLAGIDALVLFHGAVYAALAWMTATLARTGSATRTAAAAGLAIGIGLPFWSPRPLALGLLAMAATVLIVERRWPPWLLVPVAWVWVNSHGSFVLGGAWLVLTVVTARAGAPRRLAWFAVGAVLGAVNPLGPRLLLFPLHLAGRRQNLARVVEWGPPVPARTPLGWLGVVCLVVTIAVLAAGVAKRRVSLRGVAPAALFLGAGLVAQRNLALAAIVTAPVLGAALAPTEPGAKTGQRSLLDRGAGVLVTVTAAVFVVAALRSDPLDLDGYPPRRLVAVAARSDRVVSTDVAGGYRILLDGARARVFVDDRYDMYPRRVIRDFVHLLDGRRGSLAVLDRYRADAVLWPRDEELASILDASSSWRREAAAGGWVVWVRV